MPSNMKVEQKITITASASTKFKREIGRLMGDFIRQYKLESKISGGLNAFKEIFKSNLYITIDNFYDPKEHTEMALIDFDPVRIKALNEGESKIIRDKEGRRYAFCMSGGRIKIFPEKC